MLDASALGALFNKTSRGAVEVGVDIPPLEPDEARVVSRFAIELFLLDLKRRGEEGERLPRLISFKGLDIVDSFYLFPASPAPSGLGFENCRFRAGAMFEGLALRDLSIRNSAIGQQLSIRNCAIADTLSLLDVEAEAVEIRLTSSRRASVVGLHMRSDRAATIAECNIDILSIVAARCAELKIEGGSFDTMGLENHGAVQSSLNRVRCGKKLTVQPSELAEKVLVRDLENEGDVEFR